MTPPRPRPSETPSEAPRKEWIRRWRGGRVRLVGNPPREVFYIRKWFDGVRVSFALDVTTEEDALAEWALWKKNPAVYKTGKQAAAETIRKRATAAGLDPDTLAEFHAHAAERVRKGDLSKAYADRVLIPYLKAWAKALGPRPFRDVALSDLRAALKGWDTAHQKRIVALKAFTAWARKSGKIDRKDDPTLDLTPDPTVAEQVIRPKGYTIEQVEQLYRNLPLQSVRDTILIRAKTGVHESEIDRVARGRGQIIPVSDPSGIAAVVVFAHLKKGKAHAVSVDAQTLAAMERLHTRGRAPSNTVVVRELAKVAIKKHGCGGVRKKWTTQRKKRNTTRTDVLVFPCDACNPMSPGELRHSFATWATTVGEEVWPQNQRGVDLAKVSERMGHLSKRTTSEFYVGAHVPMMICVPIRLEHPDDSAPIIVSEAKPVAIAPAVTLSVAH